MSDDHSMTCDDFNIDGKFDGIGNDGTGAFTAPIAKYVSGDYPPGQYRVNIRGTTELAETPRTDTTFFILTLTDPCDPPSSLLPPQPGFVNQEYELGSAEKEYTHPAFRIEPEECQYDVEYIYTDLADGRTAL